jgi:hypothetical protein
VCTYKNENAKRFFFSYKNNSFDKYDRRKKKEKKKRKKEKRRSFNDLGSSLWGWDNTATNNLKYFEEL